MISYISFNMTTIKFVKLYESEEDTIILKKIVNVLYRVGISYNKFNIRKDINGNYYIELKQNGISVYYNIFPLNKLYDALKDISFIRDVSFHMIINNSPYETLKIQLTRNRW